LFFTLITIFGGWFGFRGPTPWTGAAWGVPVLVWLLLFAICWAVAGNPVSVLVH
jgi:hypothetical protein